jgi:hypothetical protein
MAARRTTRSSRKNGRTSRRGNAAAQRSDLDIFREGREFYNLLKKDFRNVGYDGKTGRGWANIGSGGRLEFHTSGGDPAVIVQIYPKSLKARPDAAMRAVREITHVYERL